MGDDEKKKKKSFCRMPQKSSKKLKNGSKKAQKVSKKRTFFLFFFGRVSCVVILTAADTAQVTIAATAQKATMTTMLDTDWPGAISTIWAPKKQNLIGKQRGN
jgi:hypothetical protein